MSPSIGNDKESERLSESISEDSDYGSMDNSVALPDVAFSSAHLKYLNEQLSALEPEEILRWALITLPVLYQTTALGLTGWHRHVLLECKADF
jgi:phosphoadenosine phosphosulfate reductase